MTDRTRSPQRNAAGVRARARLLDAAERLFADRGYAATSIREIVRNAQCNVSSVRYHFDGKEKLYCDVFRRRLESLREEKLELLRSMFAERTADLTVESILRAYGAAFVRPLVEHGESQRFLRLFSWELIEPRLPRIMFLEELISPVVGLLVEGLTRVSPTSDRTMLERTVHSFIAQLLYLVSMRGYFYGAGGVLHDTEMPFDALDHIVGLTHHGLRGMAEETDS